jgi:hypothetical protein
MFIDGENYWISCVTCCCYKFIRRCEMCFSVPPTDCIIPHYDVFQCSTYWLYHTTMCDVFQCSTYWLYHTTLYDVFQCSTYWLSHHTVWCVSVFQLLTVSHHTMMCFSVPATDCITPHCMICFSVPPTSDHTDWCVSVFHLLTIRPHCMMCFSVSATNSMKPIKYKHNYGARDSKSHPVSWYNTKLSWREFAEQNCVPLKENARFLFIDMHSTPHAGKA